MTTGQIWTELLDRLTRATADQLQGRDLAAWAHDRWWTLKEGELAHETGAEADLLREILDDIDARWEISISNALIGGGRAAAEAYEFPSDWLAEWSRQVRCRSRETSEPTQQSHSPTGGHIP